MSATAVLLRLARHETTVHLLTGSLLTLLEHPDQKAKLVADWSKASAAVDEVLRDFTPVQLTKPGYATRGMELYGQQIPQGEFFMQLLGAGTFAVPHRDYLDAASSPGALRQEARQPQRGCTS